MIFNVHKLLSNVVYLNPCIFKYPKYFAALNRTIRPLLVWNGGAFVIVFPKGIVGVEIYPILTSLLQPKRTHLYAILLVFRPRVRTLTIKT